MTFPCPLGARAYHRRGCVTPATATRTPRAATSLRTAAMVPMSRIRIAVSLIHIGVRGGGGGGGGGCSSPIFFQVAIFGQNPLVFGQALEKIFGQEISAPSPPQKKKNNETSPVRLY